MSRELRIDGSVQVYLQIGLKELRDVAAANHYDMLAYIIEMALSEATRLPERRYEDGATLHLPQQ